MKVTTMQYNVLKGKPFDNLNTVERLSEKLDTDLLVLPELAFTGYYFETADAIAPYVDAAIHAKIIERLRTLSEKKSMGIITGMALSEKEGLYNAVVAIDEQGIVHVHRKISLTQNERIFSRGKTAEVFSFKGVNIGIMICFEAWFPRFCDHLRRSGAQLFVMPSNFGGPWTIDVARVRALENNRPLVMTNRTGSEWIDEEEALFLGESRIIDAYGNVCASCSGKEAVKTFEITIPEADDFKSVITPFMEHEHETIEHVIIGHGKTKQ